MLPVAGINFLAAFVDDAFQLRAVRVVKNFGATVDRRMTFLAIDLKKLMNVDGHLRQLGSWQGLEVFDDDIQRAHRINLVPAKATDKSLCGRW